MTSNEISLDNERRLANPTAGNEVVITGISGRLPKSHDVMDFFQKLTQETDFLTDCPKEWIALESKNPLRMGLLNQKEKFDNGFFGIHHYQSEALDPGCRILLETSFEAILDAGLNPLDLKGTKTGVFIATNYQESELLLLHKHLQSPHFGITGWLRNVLAEQISYYFQLEGPAITLDSACCGGGYVLEEAFRAIRSGRCENAIVGGSNLILNCRFTAMATELGSIDRSGKNWVFDEKVNGYVRSEGISIILLQKLQYARRVYAQILHVKSNSDGFKEKGIMHPSMESQTNLLFNLYNEAGVNPLNLHYFEAHSTGTKAGDPEEIGAIEEVFCKNRNTPLFVGSVKSNVGHCESVSAFCSLIRVVLALEKGLMPPNINCVNERKDVPAFHNGKIVVLKKTLNMENEKYVGINNSGFGGTNAHILIKAIKLPKVVKRSSWKQRLICVSARTELGIKTILTSVKENCENEEYIDLIQHIFRKEINGFAYKGFAIKTNDKITLQSFKMFKRNNVCLSLKFGGPSNTDFQLLSELSAIPVFGDTIRKVEAILRPTDFSFQELCTNTEQPDLKWRFLVSIVAQIAFYETFNYLEIPINCLNFSSSGIIASEYAKGNLKLEEALLCGYQFLEFLKTTDGGNGIALRYLKKDEGQLLQQSLMKVLKKSNSHETALTTTQALLTNMIDCNLKYITGISLESGDFPSFKVTDMNSLLIIMGRLYETGFNLKLEKLYLRADWPVKAPMISSLMSWNHYENWYVSPPTFKPNNGTEVIDITFTNSDDPWNFLLGHVVNGRNVIPGCALLYWVWEKFASIKRSIMSESKIMFENVKLHQPFILQEGRNVQFTVQILKVSQRFELIHSNEILVSGTVKLPRFFYEQPLEYTQIPCKINQPLLKKSIYRQLNLQRFSYRDQFCGMEEINFDGTQALLKWNNNWVTFIDHMIAMKFVRELSEHLTIPTAIDRLIIDPTKKLESFETAYCGPDCNIIRCSAVEIRGLVMTPIFKRAVMDLPVLQYYEFIPYVAELEMNQLIRVNIKIILENLKKSNLRMVEVVDKFFQRNKLLAAKIELLLQELVIQNDITVFCSQSVSYENIKVQNKDIECIDKDTDLVIISDASERVEMFEKLLSKLNNNAYILIRENKNCSIAQFYQIPRAEVITVYHCSSEVVFLLKKIGTFTKPHVISITSDLTWLHDLQIALRVSENILLLAHKDPTSGVLGFINCLKYEYNKQISCVFIMDDRKFHLDNEFFKNQLKKSLLMNILKDGKWGTYVHFHLDLTRTVKCEHVQGTIQKGMINSFEWIQGPLIASVPTEQELAFVYYVGLNFKDVMVASGRINLGSYYGGTESDHFNLGFEFSGKTISGKRIMGLVEEGALSNLVSYNKYLTWEIPDNWTMEDAATVPLTYSTVLYALIVVGRINFGQTILIHSGCGGIGQSAINVALHFNCVIFTTVGTSEKRDVLKMLYPTLSDSHIGFSRDTSFEQMVMKETNGKGVDLILNSLTEEKLQTSLRCLAANGKFLEIGKYDSLRNENLSISNCKQFTGVHIDAIFNTDIQTKNKIRNLVEDGIRFGYVKPLHRFKTFENHKVENALKLMASGKHTGKVVIKMKIEEENHNIVPKSKIPAAKPRFYCHFNKVYILVGGLGGFGLELTDWLIKRGARTVVLVTRRILLNDYQNFKITVWRESGVNIVVSHLNLYTLENCTKLLHESNKLGAIDGIFNLAAIISDALFEDQTKDKFISTFAPKVLLTKNLDIVTRQHCPDLKYFVAFSSFTCGRGNIGQTNYGMANSIMERICEIRKKHGYPSLIIQWGFIADVGLSEEPGNSNAFGAIKVISKQKVTSCLQVLDVLLNQDHAIVSSSVPATMDSSEPTNIDLYTEIANILGLNLKYVSLNSTLSQLGMDSIASVEIKQLLEDKFEIMKSIPELRNITLHQLKEDENKNKIVDYKVRNQLKI